MEDRYVIRTYACDAVNWLDVCPPIACDYFFVRNLGASGLKIRTDPQNPESEMTIGSGGQEIVAAPARSTHESRFDNTTPVFYMQSVAATGQALCVFLR